MLLQSFRIVSNTPTIFVKSFVDDFAEISNENLDKTADGPSTDGIKYSYEGNIMIVTVSKEMTILSSIIKQGFDSCSNAKCSQCSTENPINKIIIDSQCDKEINIGSGVNSDSVIDH